MRDAAEKMRGSTGRRKGTLERLRPAAPGTGAPGRRGWKRKRRVRAAAWKTRAEPSTETAPGDRHGCDRLSAAAGWGP